MRTQQDTRGHGITPVRDREVWGAFNPFVFSELGLAIRLASLAIVLDCR